MHNTKIVDILQIITLNPFLQVHLLRYFYEGIINWYGLSFVYSLGLPNVSQRYVQPYIVMFSIPTQGVGFTFTLYTM